MCEVNMGQIESDEIREASGIAASSNGMEEMIRGLRYPTESIHIILMPAHLLKQEK